MKLNKHLVKANKSYLSHFKGAFLTFSQCLLAAFAALIHGILPFIFETTASDTIRKIYKRQNR